MKHQNNNTFRQLLLLALFGLGTLIAASGCGGKSEDVPELATVTGTVTMDGNPLGNAIVSFYPDAGGRPSVGNTNDQGQYELRFNQNLKGASIGTHAVKITTVTENPTPEPDPIPENYNDKSTLTANVKSGANEFDFELTSK